MAVCSVRKVLMLLSIFDTPSPLSAARARPALHHASAAYCQTYKEEKARLAKRPGSSWPSSAFNDEVGDAGEFAVSFGRLESVAPEEIKGDITTLKAVYQKIHDGPS